MYCLSSRKNYIYGYILKFLIEKAVPVIRKFTIISTRSLFLSGMRFVIKFLDHKEVSSMEVHKSIIIKSKRIPYRIIKCLRNKL